MSDEIYNSDKLRELPVGTTFHVVNGYWDGEIVLDNNFEKSVRIIGGHGYSARQVIIDTKEKPIKIKSDFELILSDIILPEDAGQVPDLTKEYLEYLETEYGIR